MLSVNLTHTVIVAKPKKGHTNSLHLYVLSTA